MYLGTVHDEKKRKVGTEGPHRNKEHWHKAISGTLLDLT
jgi:hypothetical protein